LSKLVARDGVKAGEVQPYRQADLNGNLITPRSTGNEVTACREFEFESLDALEIAPWLLLQAAQEKAHEIVAAATIESQQLRQQVSDESAAAARAQAVQELMPSLAAFASAAQLMTTFEEQFLNRCAPQIVALALEIAEKIVSKAVVADPTIVASVLERAKHEALDAKYLRVCLNPTDHRVLAEIRPDLVKVGGDGNRTVEVVATEEVGRGGCRLETESGVVDATIATQIDEIRRQLLDTEL